jgi:hypothetical protein
LFLIFLYAVFKVQATQGATYLYKSLRMLYTNPGSHLLSHAVSGIVPSAGQGLTIVFGMETGVTPGRIATGNFRYRDIFFYRRYIGN